MADHLTIPIVRDLDALGTDRLEVEVDSVAQVDRVALWGPERNSIGFGFGSSAAGGFGFGCGYGAALAFGEGGFGYGYFGQGAAILDQLTLAQFAAADYSVRTRSHDVAGNVGAWSTAVTIAHRPAPPAPTAPTVTAGVLSWSWSDP